MATAQGRQLLDVGDRFPDIRAKTTSGASIAIPQDFGGYPFVLIIYRGSW